MNRRIGLVVAAFAFAHLATVSALAQDPILIVSVEPDPVSIPAGGRTELRVVAENRSVHEADDFEVDWIGTEDVALLSQPEPIEVLPAFATDTLRLVLSAPADAAPGERTARFDAVYTYCVGEVCYQIVEELAVTVAVEEARTEDPDGDETPVPVVSGVEEPPRFPWRWVGLGIVAVLAGFALAFARRPGRSVAVLSLVLVGALAYGVLRGQHEQAQSIGAVLCTSCVGIEEAPNAHDVRLSTSAVEALEGLDEPVELIVYYAEWCHSCPYAEAMVERMAEVTDRIEYAFVDVDAEPDAARARGVIRSGRTVVPAIVRTDSETVVFGVEDLEARLLDLLGVGG